MIIDCHNHIGFENELEKQNSQELLAKMNKSKVKKSVIFPFAPMKKDGSTFKDNERIARISKDSDRFIGFGRINQLSSDCLEEVDHILDLKLKGVKFHTRHSNIQDAQKILNKLAPHKLPIIVHTENGPKTHVSNISKINYPHPIIIAHAGKSGVKEAIKIVNDSSNIYLDLSIVSLFKVRYILSKINHSRVLFGSDTPYSDPILDINKVKLATSDRKLRAKILGENFIELMQGKI
jgi:uncharacterized protein